MENVTSLNQNKYETYDNRYLGEYTEPATHEFFTVVQIAEDEIYFRNLSNTGADFYISKEYFDKRLNNKVFQ